MAYSREMRYRDQFAKQASIGAAAHLLAESASALGWDLAAFNVDREVNMPRNSDGGFIGAAMGWPLECVNAWVGQSMANHCPVTQLCGRVTDSFIWDCDPAGSAWRNASLSASHCEVLDHLGRYMDGAATVPVHRPGGKAGYVSWFMRDGRALSERHQATYDATYLISHAFMRRVDEIIGAHRKAAMGDNAVSLSPREIECLTWAASGKTAEEIGMIIERSHETARFHLRNAIQKLNASNRTHAVAIACSRGVITVT